MRDVESRYSRFQYMRQYQYTLHYYNSKFPHEDFSLLRSEVENYHGKSRSYQSRSFNER